MRLRRLSIAAVLVSGLASSGCTQFSGVRVDPLKTERIIPPGMTGSHPLTLTSPRKVNLAIEVPIDAFGNPNVPAMRLVGNADDATRQDLAVWIGSSTFRPARQGGVAVPGLFKMKLKSR